MGVSNFVIRFRTNFREDYVNKCFEEFSKEHDGSSHVYDLLRVINGLNDKHGIAPIEVYLKRDGFTLAEADKVILVDINKSIQVQFTPDDIITSGCIEVLYCEKISSKFLLYDSVKEIVGYYTSLDLCKQVFNIIQSRVVESRGINLDEIRSFVKSKSNVHSEEANYVLKVSHNSERIPKTVDYGVLYLDAKTGNGHAVMNTTLNISNMRIK